LISGVSKGSSAFDCMTLSEMLISLAWLNTLYFPLLSSLSSFDHVASIDGIAKIILLDPHRKTVEDQLP